MFFGTQCTVLYHNMNHIVINHTYILFSYRFQSNRKTKSAE